MNAKKLLAIAFLITFVIYLLVLYQNMQAHEEWKKTQLEEYPPEIRPYVDFDPYRSSKPGQQMTILGIIIFMGWLIALILPEPALSKRKTNKPKLNKELTQFVNRTHTAAAKNLMSSL